MRFNWFPWKYIVKRAARSRGFMDPFVILGQLERFIQPSEVNVPIELLRAGAVMHARGLINSRVIQHNLDWVWPFWVERQFNPKNIAFIPRAFSITHINLTHRNWTAVGLPDYPDLPIVDPRGLLTPFLDKWSLDTWILTNRGNILLPSRAKLASQTLELNDDLTLVTNVADGLGQITGRINVEIKEGLPTCTLEIEARCEEEAWLVVALRPYNPEGISFIYELNTNDQHTCWLIDNSDKVIFNQPIDSLHISNYQKGDVFIHLQDSAEEYQGVCDIGMLTAAALFKLDSDTGSRHLTVSIPLTTKNEKKQTGNQSWRSNLNDACKLHVPDKKMQFLFESAKRTLLLHSSEDIYPGPYTYKRFWFRDAVFIAYALLCVGLNKRVQRAIDKFPKRQDGDGYFHSQQGEWDSNGEVLWLLQQYCRLNGTPPKPEWREMILKGSRWIINKRTDNDTDEKITGLFPAGFSAEHLGPNDYYYWDNFWGMAGLKAASELFLLYNDQNLEDEFKKAGKSFQKTINDSLASCAKSIGRKAIPASPYRRLDAGVIGSLAIGYPTQICAADDERLLDSAEFLLQNCCVDNGFFQDMTHSGINPYLTLHLAQVLMRAGDARFLPLMQRTADLASETGQWPEAIHPHTGGGCMGDGQHVWAAAEWIIMMRNCFIREEAGYLVIGAGIPLSWLKTSEEIYFGPAPTAFGTVQISIKKNAGKKIDICWQAKWHSAAPKIEIRLPDLPVKSVLPGLFHTVINMEQ